MREILFKAKLKDWKTNQQQNKWAEGYYLSKKETTYCFAEDYEKFPVKTLHYIAVDSMTDWGLPNEFRCYEIDPDTLCQYTGQNDMNQNKIWENDIVKKEFYTDYERFANSEEYIGEVEYEDCAWNIVYNKDGHKFVHPMLMAIEFGESNHYRVISNIFDNPELLKGEEISK